VAPRAGLAANTYDYVLTALREIDAVAHTLGETIVSSTTAVVIAGPNNAVQLNWTPSVNAQAYKLYRKLSADGTFANSLIATIPGGASSSFLDDGYTEDGITTPPGANTATNRPADHAVYYTTYVAVV